MAEIGDTGQAGWDEACRREAAIRDLVNRDPKRLKIGAVGAVGREVGVGRATLYRRIARFRRTRAVEDLRGPGSGRPEGTRVLNADEEWLLNDAFVYFDNRNDKDAEADASPALDAPHPECCAILLPLLDAQRGPRPWLRPALRRAATANAEACAAAGVPTYCAPVSPTIWETCRSEERQFTRRDCSFASGQRVDVNHCVKPQAGQRGTDFDWPSVLVGNPTQGPTAAEPNRFCPRLMLDVRSADGNITISRVQLPKDAAMNDAARYRADFFARVRPGTEEFLLSGGVRD